ncbi:MAG TPA: NUDIX domain-containing protein [Puia sp.]|nr:NUDIX domain-containing protein [Puia sp.]
MLKMSAGILLFRFKNIKPEVLLFHPGGPYWAKKDAGVWSIPKGQLNEDEDPLSAAKRELKEETGIDIKGKLIQLTPIKQKNNKTVFAWSLEQDFDLLNLKSNLFEIEWPPKSGKKMQFPEMDKGAWFTIDEAKVKILPAQLPFIIELEKMI